MTDFVPSDVARNSVKIAPFYAEAPLSRVKGSQVRTLISRFVLAGAVIGSFAGLCEGTFLYLSPQPPLLRPDTQSVILFLAPLGACAVFTILGLILGIVATRGRQWNPRRAAGFAAAGLGIAGVYIMAAVHLINGVGHGSVLQALTQKLPLLWLAALSGGSWLVIRLLWRWLRPFFDVEPVLKSKLLKVAVVASIALGPCGTAFYILRQPSQLRAVPLAAASGGATGPNIILITLDTVRADHLSAYGYPFPTTPNLDRLAQKGVLFENAISPSSWTLASHGSIFTGLLPHQHGGNWAAPIDPRPWTLADVLASRGYETAGFSSNIVYGYSGWGMGQGFEMYDDDSRSVEHNLTKTRVAQGIVLPFYRKFVGKNYFERRSAGELNRDVAGWLRHRSSHPYFLFINYFDVHSPYLAPSGYDGRFGRMSKDLLNKWLVKNRVPHPSHFGPDDQRSVVGSYDNCVSYLDEQVGKLAGMIARTQDAAKTIFIITSDHGEAFGEHGPYGHGWDLHREVVRVPLIIIGSGIPAGVKINAIVPTQELFSTVLDIAWSGKSPFHTTSLSRFWSPDFSPGPSDDAIVSELVSYHSGGQWISASLTTPAWKYIHDASGRSELYHWPSDLNEQKDLAGSPSYKTVLDSLRNRLNERIASSLGPWRGPEYLLGLDGPAYSFMRNTGLRFHSGEDPPDGEPRIGSAQAYFPVKTPDRYISLPQPDKDLLESLPYH